MRINGPILNTPRSPLGLASIAGLGAGLMYFLDPDRGVRRRKLVEDKVVHARHVSGETAQKTARDLRNRARGTAVAAGHRLARDEADDRVIEERVRAELGRVVSHPSAIEVLAEDGRVTLAGPVLAREGDRLIRRVRRVRGVRGVEDRLEQHETAEGIPALQGGIPRTGGEFELQQENWAPAARLLTTAAGSSLAWFGVRRRGMLGATLGVAGFALAVRGATNKQLKRVIGVGGGRRAVDKTTIETGTPPHDAAAEQLP
jgi:hypothetical protein